MQECTSLVGLIGFLKIVWGFIFWLWFCDWFFKNLVANWLAKYIWPVNPVANSLAKYVWPVNPVTDSLAQNIGLAKKPIHPITNLCFLCGGKLTNRFESHSGSQLAGCHWRLTDFWQPASWLPSWNFMAASMLAAIMKFRGSQHAGCHCWNGICWY